MTAKAALCREIEIKREQLEMLRTSLDQEENDNERVQRALTLIKQAERSFDGAEFHIAQGIWKDGVYLLSQGVWNLGCAYGTARAL